MISSLATKPGAHSRCNYRHLKSMCSFTLAIQPNCGVSFFKRALKILGSTDAELRLVIAGNHDLELDKPYWEAHRDYKGNAEDPENHHLAVKA